MFVYGEKTLTVQEKISGTMVATSFFFLISLDVPTVVERIREALSKICVLIPRTCEYAILCVKKGFADMFKLRILRWEITLGYPVGPM